MEKFLDYICEPLVDDSFPFYRFILSVLLFTPAFLLAAVYYLFKPF